MYSFHSRPSWSFPFVRWAGGSLVTLMLLVVASGCEAKPTPDPGNPETVGSLNVNLAPDSASVVVTGPGSYSQTFTGSELLVDLAPGDYEVSATAPGYFDGAGGINVVAGQTSSLSLTLTTASGTVVTAGSLNVSVTPASAAVMVAGPDSFARNFTGNQLLTDLDPGQYAVEASATGYYGNSGTINVEVGESSSITFILQPTPIVIESPRAVYRDGQGNLVVLDNDTLHEGQIVFYAWLDDETEGIDPGVLGAASDQDPCAPLLSEQDESGPSFSQNLGAAWVGFVESPGVVRPIIGADVR